MGHWTKPQLKIQNKTEEQKNKNFNPKMWTTEKKKTHKYYDNDCDNGMDFIHEAECKSTKNSTEVTYCVHVCF